MEIKCSRQALSDAFAVAAMAAPIRSPKEILQNVKLVASGERIRLEATNTEISVTTEVEDDGIDVVKGGTVLLPVRMTSSILRESNDDKISLSMDGDSIKVEGARSKFKLPTANPEEFPKLNQFEIDLFNTITVAQLQMALQRTVYAIDATASRFALGGVKIEADGSGMTFVGTDGRRLSVQEVASETCNVDYTHDCIVPKFGVNVVQRAITGEGDVDISLGTNEIMFRKGSTVVSSRLVEGKFPNWRQVIPDVSEYREGVDFSAGVFHQAVRQASIVTDKESSGVNLSFSQGNLTISAKTAEIGDSSVTVPISYDDDDSVVRVDHRYVSDICKALDSQDGFTLQFLEKGDAVLFTTDNGYRCVVMPMQVDG